MFGGRICFQLSLHMGSLVGIPFQKVLNLKHQIQMLKIKGGQQEVVCGEMKEHKIIMGFRKSGLLSP